MIQIGQCTLYCADALELVRELDYDCFLADPPNGYSFTGPQTPTGPAVIEKLTGPGIVFPGTLQMHLYPPADDICDILVPDADTQPILFYGIKGEDSYSPPLSSVISRHPAAKPISWFSWALLHLKGTVLDPFMGSGSSAVAAVRMNRPYIGIEVIPQYFELACERIQKAYDMRHTATQERATVC